MAKETKTEIELERMIAEQLSDPIVSISVTPDPVRGWHAQAVTDVGKSFAVTEKVDKIAAQLRNKYDLEG